jgi:hypothetical protein
MLYLYDRKMWLAGDFMKLQDLSPQWGSVARSVLAFCLLGLATASAQQVFAVNGSLVDGSVFNGTITITGTTVTNSNIAIGAPASVTCGGTPIIQNPNPPSGYFFRVTCTSGALLTLVLSTPADPAGGTLTNYAGGGLDVQSHLTTTPPPTPIPVANGAVALTFQVHYASNLINGGDSVINITNTGASASAVLTPGQIVGGVNQNNINGDLCVNIYTFAADEQEIACCSCLVTPNALWSASVKTALLNSTLTPSFPNEVVVKLISTVPNVGANGTESCNPATVNQNVVSLSTLAWGTTLHGVPTATGPSFAMTETPFASATLSGAELARDIQECQFIQILGSGQFGICKGCSNVGLGAAAQ